LTAPPLDIIPLGGLGEIGLNMMVLQCGEDLVVIDSGLMFPEKEMYGVDVVIPDFTYLLDQGHRIRGVVLTHGHEDHIGALPFFLRRFNVPVYGTRLTIELVKPKLRENQLLDQVTLHVITPEERLTLGCFSFAFMRVNHSILDGVALAVDTPQGLIVHSGDFKIDQSPMGGDRSDLGRFAECGRNGVLLLFSDSTNVERPGYTMSERSVTETLKNIFRTCSGRIIVACFASSLTRIQQVVNLAAECDRMVAFDGKSMIQNVNIARSWGYIHLPEEMETTVGGLKSYPDHRVVLITTGSQGEPMSALTRMASGDHRKIAVKKGDTVIISSRFIPGNERAITTNINNLYRQGAQVIYESVSDVHVSGHAYQEELKLMINLTRPEYFVPIHGEFRHLVKHVELARSVGLADDRTLLVRNGDRIRFENGHGKHMDTVCTGRILVDGKGVGDVGHVVLKDRRHLAEHGMVIALVVIDETSGEILSGPDIISKGFIFDDGMSDLLEDAKCLILEVFDRLNDERNEAGGLTVNLADIQSEVRRELKSFFYRVIERRPVILPQIIAL
jgi:ribonuclease J